MRVFPLTLCKRGHLWAKQILARSFDNISVMGIINVVNAIQERGRI